MIYSKHKNNKGDCMKIVIALGGNALGNNPERINKAMYEVNEEKITTLLNNNSYSFSKDIANKFENEFPDKEKYALIKSLDIPTN